MAAPREVPLFPLNTVLFPGGPLMLRIFEPRYIDMVAERMRNEQPFGVCLIRDGQEAGRAAAPHEVGTFARIVDFQQYEDNVLGVTALGEGKFRVRNVLGLLQTLSCKGQARVQLSAQRLVTLPIGGNHPAVFIQHRAAGLGLARTRAGALKCVVAAAGIVLDIFERRLQLRIPLIEPVELGLNGLQVPRRVTGC